MKNIETLIECVRTRKKFEREIEIRTGDLKARIKEAVGNLPEGLKNVKRTETALRARLGEEYSIETEKRREKLLRGEECPPIPLPDGVSVTWGKDLEIDENAPLLTAAANLGFVSIDYPAIKKHLESGGFLTGFSLVPKPIFTIREKDQKGS